MAHQWLLNASLFGLLINNFIEFVLMNQSKNTHKLVLNSIVNLQIDLDLRSLHTESGIFICVFSFFFGFVILLTGMPTINGNSRLFFLVGL